ncbi:hypothetical protein [Exercitatus varius]|nr:hypothetical protein [Exercitatus varius]MDG2941616.1 hypothetical protein [Exercitatus varius]
MNAAKVAKPLARLKGVNNEQLAAVIDNVVQNAVDWQMSEAHTKAKIT